MSTKSSHSRLEGVVPGDVVMVAQKVVSKAEGRIVELADVRPGAPARALAQATGKDPALCELILPRARGSCAGAGGP